EVRNLPQLMAFSHELYEQQLTLKRFLRTKLYQHYRVNRMSAKANRIIKELFNAFIEDIRLMPDDFQQKALENKPRAVADYIAGMTDRYAIREHQRIYAVSEREL
ncbi:MAG TPA: deoxyguanosinetriphosphate triphosphohydrolase, partial [Methyloradius sp.]